LSAFPLEADTPPRSGDVGFVSEAEASGGQNPSRLDALDEAGGRHDALYRSSG
jgi:hypothetical protein